MTVCLLDMSNKHTVFQFEKNCLVMSEKGHMEVITHPLNEEERTLLGSKLIFLSLTEL